MRAGSSPANANARMRPSGRVSPRRGRAPRPSRAARAAPSVIAAGVADGDRAVGRSKYGAQLRQRLERLPVARADVVARPRANAGRRGRPGRSPRASRPRRARRSRGWWRASANSSCASREMRELARQHLGGLAHDQAADRVGQPLDERDARREHARAEARRARRASPAASAPRAHEAREAVASCRGRTSADSWLIDSMPPARTSRGVRRRRSGTPRR